MLDHQLRGDGTTAGEIYFLPGVYADEAAIEAAMTADTLQKTVDFSKANNTIEDKQTSLGKITMAAGENTLVFKATAKRQSAACCYMFIKSLTATLDTSSSTDIQEAYYDFKLSSKLLAEGSDKVFVDRVVSSTDVITALSNYYDANELNWKYAANNLGANDSDFSVFCGKAYPGNGLRFAAKFSGSYAPGHWTAITVKSPGEGTFNISLDYQIRGDGNTAEKVYLIEGALTDKTVIEEAMTAANLLGTVNGKVAPDGSTTALSSWNVNLGKRTLSDGEYTLVFHASAATGNYFFASGVKMVEQIQQDSEESSGDTTTGDTTTGESITLPSTEPQEPAPVVPMGYDFQIGGSNLTVGGESFGDKTLDSANVLTALKDYYDTGILSWNFSGVNNFESFKTSNNAIAPMYYIGGGSYKWTGVRMGLRVTEPEKDPETGNDVYSYPAGVWTAVTVKSPGKGLYDIVLDYQIRADGTPNGEIYLLKGNITDQKAINKALKEENLLKTVSFFSKTFDMTDRTTTLATKQLEVGEYTLVFKAASSSAGNFFYINQLQFNKTQPKPEKKPLQVDELDIDFTVGQKLEDLNGNLSAGKLLTDSDIQEAMAQYYEERKISWKYSMDNFASFQKSNNVVYNMDYIGGTDTYKWAGLRLGIKVGGPKTDEKGELVNTFPAGHWTALTLESPGKGLYYLSLDYQTRADATPAGEIYLIPGTFKDAKALEKAMTPDNLLKTIKWNITAAMDHSNRVGKITFHNETGEPQVVDGAVTQLGTWNFQAGKEYIMVLEAYDNSPFKAKNSYMWISQLIANEGNVMKQQSQTKKINSIVVDSSPVVQFGIGMYGAVSQVSGQDYFYFPTEGKQMLVYNLEDMARVRKVSTPFTSSKGMCVDKDGKVWMVGDAQVLWCYDPYTNTGFETRNFKLSAGFDDTTTCFYCCTGSDGNIYFGSHSKGYIGQYNPKTDTFKKVTGGVLNNDSVYSSDLIERDGYLYACINGDRNKDGKVTAEVVKIDLKADKVVGRVDISEQFGQEEVMARGVGLAGDTLFVGGISMKAFVAVDINTMQLKDYGIEKQIAIGTTEEINGKVYMMISGIGIHEYDVASDTITAIKGIDSAVAGFRCGETNAVTLEHNPLFPGISYVTFGGTGIKIYNVERKIVYTPPLIDEEKDGSGQVIRTIIRGPVGSNQLYIGGFNTDTSAIYDITTGKTVSLFDTEGQTDTLMWYDGNLYAGNYPGGYITRVNLEDNNRNVILQSLNNTHGQARVHALAAGDGMLFAGSIPDWYSYGGVLVAIDLETLDRTIVEDIVPYQSVTGLVYRDGYVFGTTSVAGGSGAEAAYNDTVSAVIFVYDVEKKEKVAELDLRDYFGYLPETLPYVDGIALDPNGQLWGVISETVFTFDFNPTTKKFTVKKQLSFDDASKTNTMAAEGRSWKMCDFDFFDGYMYVALGTRGGMQKINYNNPSDHSRINCETPRNFVIGEDGNLYYALNTYELKMYPLNVTSEDWAAADKVDKMILAIKQPVTIEDEEQVQAALDAYEALSWEHKALVQNYEILEIAKTDLLEAKIDTIGEVTLESEELIRGLLEQYDALSARQKKYVKNYQILNAADLALQELINAREAARVQKLLDEGIKALGEITLEDEEALKKLREAYDALTFLQRQLVDATGLLDAEAIIYKLRQEIVQKLIQMIASIGEVTLEDEPVIEEALEIFEWLTLDERNQVDFTTLNNASKELTKLQKAAAAEVDALIAAIGSRVTYFSGGAIKAARAAYDALTPGSQAYVKNIAILLQAEEIYNGMFPLGAIIVIVVVVAAGGAGAAWFILRKKKLQKAQVSAETAENTQPQETEAQE